MRSVLVVLLLIDLALFGWWQGWFDAWSGRGAAVPAELHPERLRVVPIDRLGGPPGRPIPPLRAAPAGAGGLFANEARPNEPRPAQQLARILSSSEVVERSKRNGIE